MTESLKDLIAEVLWEYFDSTRKDGYIVDGVTGDEAAALVTDLLIDLAGTGQLLASIDRIARS